MRETDAVPDVLSAGLVRVLVPVVLLLAPVQDPGGDAVRQEAHRSARVGVVLVRAQRLEFGGEDLLDAGGPVVVERVDHPHTVAGLAGGGRCRAGAGCAREVGEDARPRDSGVRLLDEPADLGGQIAQPLPGVAEDTVEVLRVESERVVLAHEGLLRSRAARAAVIPPVWALSPDRATIPVWRDLRRRAPRGRSATSRAPRQAGRAGR
ncbi:hypothetical protein RHRU231_590095 [Rhodococcus ruber]|uniref:Uncharacterized protein n=1 Tax=Rhodococcus ruber TaxID=1830 RepID=A0A098BQN3_9NOCA|nr:hypothetical protein RHRU231_590095 [Rhodococcus ruber]